MDSDETDVSCPGCHEAIEIGTKFDCSVKTCAGSHLCRVCFMTLKKNKIKCCPCCFQSFDVCRQTLDAGDSTTLYCRFCEDDAGGSQQNSEFFCQNERCGFLCNLCASSHPANERHSVISIEQLKYSENIVCDQCHRQVAEVYDQVENKIFCAKCALVKVQSGKMGRMFSIRGQESHVLLMEIGNLLQVFLPKFKCAEKVFAKQFSDISAQQRDKFSKIKEKYKQQRIKLEQDEARELREAGADFEKQLHTAQKKFCEFRFNTNIAQYLEKQSYKIMDWSSRYKNDLPMRQLLYRVKFFAKGSALLAANLNEEAFFDNLTDAEDTSSGTDE